MTRRRAFLGLGSNLEPRGAHLRGALDLLADVVAVSRIYETAPVGGPPGQGPFLNMVVELSTEMEPRALLAVARRCEEAARRVRGERFGPRTLDVDILLVGDLVVDEGDLAVPHPRMWDRRFVLEPLAELVDLDSLPASVLPDGWAPGSWRQQVAGEVRVAGTLEGS